MAVLGLTAQDAEKLALQLAGQRAPQAVPHGLAIHAAHRGDLRGRARQEDLIGDVEVISGDLGFEDFEAMSLGRRCVGDGFFVALDGGELVGLTEPQSVDDVPSASEQNLTDVRSDYRGRGIAFALKAQAAIWAAQAGYTSIRTQNAQSNAAMLAVNDRLGFERNRATVEFLNNL